MSGQPRDRNGFGEMKDLTHGSIVSHILNMAPPIVAGMITIMICQLVDLYFVAEIGEAAVAGVAAAGNAGFLINGFMQVLGVGTVALVSHAVGRQDRSDASLIFNQAIVLSALFGLLTLVVGALLARPYMRSVAADEATVEAGTTFLLWLMPALALQFVTQVMGAALRATGIVRPTMLIQVFAVLINIALAPVLIAGWGTGYAFGVAGAGLASSIAVFLAALDKTTPQGRVAYVEATCVGDPELLRRVRELLSCHEGSQGLLDARPPGLGGTVDMPEVSERPGTFVGPYKLLQQLGEGGMGTVYMAEQTRPVKRKVALKVIKQGMDTRQVIARFEAERQALAMMDHVNIARVLDAGATEFGRPYFVMELVHGVPVTEYCDDNRLTPRERLAPRSRSTRRTRKRTTCSPRR